MEILSIKHKGLRRLLEHDDDRGLPRQHVQKIRERVGTLQAAPNLESWLTLRKGRPHALKGNRKGDYAISVTANMRLTFTYDGRRIAALDLDFEDYH